MKRKVHYFMFFCLIIFMILSGCNEFENGQKNNDDVENKAGCISALEVEQLEDDFLKMRDNLSQYMNDTEFVMEAYSDTIQKGVLTDEGSAMRIEYEQLRERYIDVMYSKCEKTNGLPITNNVWLKGYDLIKYEIHPESFLDLPFSSKSRILYEEPEYWTEETTKHMEFKYYNTTAGVSVAAKIEATHVGTVQDQWQWLADEEGFEIANFSSGEPAGSTIYYTNDYVDDYGWKYKGIFFQIYLFKVYAGYYSWGNSIGTDSEYFEGIEITENDAKNMYEELVFRPGYNDS